MRVSNDKLPGHALALSLQKVWEVIQHQKDLNLPAHKVCSPAEHTPSCVMAGLQHTSVACSELVASLQVHVQL